MEPQRWIKEEDFEAMVEEETKNLRDWARQSHLEYQRKTKELKELKEKTKMALAGVPVWIENGLYNPKNSHFDKSMNFEEKVLELEMELLYCKRAINRVEVLCATVPLIETDKIFKAIKV